MPKNLLVMVAYAKRINIECMFRELKQQVAGFGYYFWNLSIPKLNKYKKKSELDPPTDARHVFDTQLQLDLLQEYIMIPLDIFKKSMENKSIETPLEAWLSFLSSDNPDRMIELIEKYPQFKAMYETLYNMYLEVDKTMGFFSEELRIMDRNMVRLMVEEQKKELEARQETIDQHQEKLD